MDELRFSFSEAKALAALALIAKTRPGLTPLYVAKIMYFAERMHINRYGRPIVADDFIAMPQGPVPSTIKNYIDEKWNWVERPELIAEAISIDKTSRWARLMPAATPYDLSSLSETDVECLLEAVLFCTPKTADELSSITHRHAAWLKAPKNRSMDYRDFIDDTNASREEIVDMLEQCSMSEVL